MIKPVIEIVQSIELDHTLNAANDMMFQAISIEDLVEARRIRTERLTQILTEALA